MESVIKILLSVIIPGLILAFINRKLNYRGPRLVYYVSSAANFTNIFPNSPNPLVNLNVLTITIRNNGNDTARNVDISHVVWPWHFQVIPFIPHTIIQGPDGRPRIIRLANLGPGESVSVAYLYNIVVFPDLMYEYVRSEETIARRIPVILNQVYPLWFTKLLAILLALGLICIGIFIWWLYPPIAHFVKWIINFPR